jgi:hypothetical protein
VWSNGATTQDLTNIPAGTYNVTVTDAGGCTQTLNGIVITEPAAIVLTETHVNANCNGTSTGSIDLTVTGGTAPFTYCGAMEQRPRILLIYQPELIM